ncbi:MAG: division/cell wall cluster transcriptional repressor MraZ [bacterium]
MFRGRFEHTIDEKGRLSIPSKFRELLSAKGENELVLTDFDSCLTAYPKDEWRVLEEKMKQLSMIQKDVRNFLRLFYSSATEVPLDPQGRILIPPQMRERAQLDREVVLLGLLNKIEIWDKESWEDFMARSAGTFEEVASKLVELGI